MEAASQYPFLAHLRLIVLGLPGSADAVTVASLPKCYIVIAYPVYSSLEEAMAVTGVRCEKNYSHKNRSATQTPAGPTGRRCRHAEFLPYPANNATLLTELDQAS